MFRLLKLTNYRQFEDKTLTYTDGLVCVIGSSESGKSTTLEAALYALYGSRVLRDSVDNAVTWGKPTNSMSVELTIEVGGELYLFKRSPKGAEVNYSGGIVAGQNEVSGFAANLLGADLNSAERLMLASQNNLRGSLEEGPKALAQAIEGLADFDLFDRLLDAASTKLLTGSSTFLDNRVTDLERELAEFTTNVPDRKPWDDLLSASVRELEDLKPQLERAIRLKDEANSKLSTSAQTNRTYQMAQSNVEKAEQQFELHKQQKIAAEIAAQKSVDEKLLANLKKQLEYSQDLESQAKQYKQFQTLMRTFPEVFWEGNYESYQSEVTKTELQQNHLKTSIDEQSRVIQGVVERIKNLQSRITIGTHCQTCKRPLENHSELLEQNSTLKYEISFLETDKTDYERELVRLQAQLKEVNETLNVLRQLVQVAKPFDALAQTCSYVQKVDYTYPNKLEWVGLTNFDQEDTSEIKAQVALLESQKADVLRAQARIETLAETLAEDEAYIQRLKDQLSSCEPLVDLTQLQSQADSFTSEYLKWKQELSVAQNNKLEAERNIQAIEAAVSAGLQRRASLEQQIEQAKADVATLNFNNALLKKIRAARPIIADRLWSIVLSTVSTMFSQLRGEPSTVTKTKEGFFVNGSPVASLSGSTKDILGLAIRCALLKTFLPNNQLLILDEPSAACSDDRVEAMLSFLVSSGFKQILLVTHENLSETFANLVIEL